MVRGVDEGIGREKECIMLKEDESREEREETKKATAKQDQKEAKAVYDDASRR